jgi:hypothetical protein
MIISSIIVVTYLLNTLGCSLMWFKRYLLIRLPKKWMKVESPDLDSDRGIT